MVFSQAPIHHGEGQVDRKVSVRAQYMYISWQKRLLNSVRSAKEVGAKVVDLMEYIFNVNNQHQHLILTHIKYHL